MFITSIFVINIIQIEDKFNYIATILMFTANYKQKKLIKKATLLKKRS